MCCETLTLHSLPPVYIHVHVCTCVNVSHQTHSAIHVYVHCRQYVESMVLSTSPRAKQHSNLRGSRGCIIILLQRGTVEHRELRKQRTGKGKASSQSVQNDQWEICESRRTLLVQLHFSKKLFYQVLSEVTEQQIAASEYLEFRSVLYFAWFGPCSRVLICGGYIFILE